MSDQMLTTLDAYVHAVLSELETTFGTRLIDYLPYDPAVFLSDDFINTPSLYFQIEAQQSDVNVAKNITLGRFATQISCAIHLMMSTQTPNLQLALDVFSNAMLCLLFKPDPGYRLGRIPGQRWGLDLAVEPLQSAMVLPGDWRPGLHGVDSRVISFNQIVYTSSHPIEALNE